MHCRCLNSKLGPCQRSNQLRATNVKWQKVDTNLQDPLRALPYRTTCFPLSTTATRSASRSIREETSAKRQAWWLKRHPPASKGHRALPRLRNTHWCIGGPMGCTCEQAMDFTIYIYTYIYIYIHIIIYIHNYIYIYTYKQPSGILYNLVVTLSKALGLQAGEDIQRIIKSQAIAGSTKDLLAQCPGVFITSYMWVVLWTSQNLFLPQEKGNNSC